MEFPSYVPAVVQQKIAHYLEGESDRSIPGYVDLLADAESDVAKVEHVIATRLARGELDHLQSLNLQKAEALKHRDDLSSNVNCLQRLALDLRMRGAFELLRREFTDDKQWEDFIFSAWAALVNYGSYRDRLKRSRELRSEIADAAAALASLLRKYADSGVNGPDEFYWVPELLRNTDSREIQPGNVMLWRALRGQLLGDPRSRPEAEKPSSTQSGADDPPKIFVHFVQPGEKLESNSEQRTRDMLRYVWQLSPEVPALLQTLSMAARNFTPMETGMIAAAITSRQRSVKTEYLRAFENRLINSEITLTTVVMQAMAIVANVVLNSAKVDVSYDDVRKALARYGRSY